MSFTRPIKPQEAMCNADQTEIINLAVTTAIRRFSHFSCQTTKRVHFLVIDCKTAQKSLAFRSSFYLASSFSFTEITSNGEMGQILLQFVVHSPWSSIVYLSRNKFKCGFSFPSLTIPIFLVLSIDLESELSSFLARTLRSKT